MIAAARLKKVQKQAVEGRPYTEKLREVIEHLAADTGGELEHPLLEIRPEKKVIYIVIGADRGLAGSFNTNLMNKAISEIGNRDKSSVDIIAVGSKAVSFFKKHNLNLVHTINLPRGGITFHMVQTITKHINEYFEQGKVDAVYLVYAKFFSAMTQVPEVMRLLPMAKPQVSEDKLSLTDFIYEPSPKKLLASLLPRYLNILVYQAFVESQASEQGARMSAMTAATKNADEVITDLTLTYNKTRQAAITTELSEIVSGAEALD